VDIAPELPGFNLSSQMPAISRERCSESGVPEGENKKARRPSGADREAG
jgi:hypothetical protein